MGLGGASSRSRIRGRKAGKKQARKGKKDRERVRLLNVVTDTVSNTGRETTISVRGNRSVVPFRCDRGSKTNLLLAGNDGAEVQFETDITWQMGR